jgi:hypothetical protein
MLLCLFLAGCGDNLVPSGDDKRPIVPAGSTGPMVGQKARDFSVSDINTNTVTLASSLAGRKGAVFYFTMWCPICDTHMSQMRSSIVPLHPSVGFYLVDYVSGSVNDAAGAAASNGYAGPAFTTLADVNHVLSGNFNGTMGITVVVDSTGTIVMNEDFRDGTKLQAVLTGLP